MLESIDLKFESLSCLALLLLVRRCLCLVPLDMIAQNQTQTHFEALCGGAGS